MSEVIAALGLPFLTLVLQIGILFNEMRIFKHLKAQRIMLEKHRGMSDQILAALDENNRLRQLQLNQMNEIIERAGGKPVDAGVTLQ